MGASLWAAAAGAAFRFLLSNPDGAAACSVEADEQGEGKPGRFARGALWYGKTVAGAPAFVAFTCQVILVGSVCTARFNRSTIIGYPYGAELVPPW